MSRSLPIWRKFCRMMPVWHGRQELAILTTFLLAAFGFWGFAELADEVIEGDTHAIDEWLLLALRSSSDLSDPIGPAWIEELGRDFTALGGVGVLTMLTLAVAGFLALQGKRRAMTLVLVTVVSGTLMSLLLKQGFDRPRPDLVPHATEVYTASFPSGHSMMSAVTYLTLGALLARVQQGRRIRTYLLALSVLITLAIGISRIYLGVHWPTDVLAGWTAGAIWALICWSVAMWLQRRGHVERDTDQPQKQS